MIVNVTYHREDGGVWAESADVPGLSVAGATLSEVRSLVREGLPFYLEDVTEEIDLREVTDTGGLTVVADFVVGALTIAVMPGTGAQVTEITTTFQAPGIEGWTEPAATTGSSGERQLVS